MLGIFLNKCKRGERKKSGEREEQK